MLKNIKIYSVALIGSLVLIGCGGSSNDSNSQIKQLNVKKFSQGIENLSDAEKLAYAVANQNRLTKSTDSNKKRSRDLQSCQNGGTMDIVIDGDLQNSDVVIKYHDCNEDGEISNGTMKFEHMSDDGEAGKIIFVTDFRVTGGSDEVFVKKGGTMQRFKEGAWYKEIVNVEMTINGITHGGENLIYKEKSLEDGTYIEFPISGKEKIGDSAYFTVDTTYDASKTPFREDKDGNLLKGGLFKYKDSKNHTVMLEVMDTNIIKVSIDSDGDGKFSADEVSAIDLKH